MAESEDISTSILWLMERKMHQADQKVEKVHHQKKVKEVKKAKKHMTLTIPISDRHVLERFVAGCPIPGDADHYARLETEGFMLSVMVQGRPVRGVTPKGSEVMRY